MLCTYTTQATQYNHVHWSVCGTQDACAHWHDLIWYAIEDPICIASHDLTLHGTSNANLYSNTTPLAERFMSYKDSNYKHCPRTYILAVGSTPSEFGRKYQNQMTKPVTTTRTLWNDRVSNNPPPPPENGPLAPSPLLHSVASRHSMHQSLIVAHHAMCEELSSPALVDVGIRPGKTQWSPVNSWFHEV